MGAPPIQLAGDYAPERADAYEALVARALATAPAELAEPLEQYRANLEAGRAGMAIKHARRVATTLVQAAAASTLVGMDDEQLAEPTIEAVMVLLLEQRDAEITVWVDDLLAPLLDREDQSPLRGLLRGLLGRAETRAALARVEAKPPRTEPRVPFETWARSQLAKGGLEALALELLEACTTLWEPGDGDTGSSSLVPHPTLLLAEHSAAATARAVAADHLARRRYPDVIAILYGRYRHALEAGDHPGAAECRRGLFEIGAQLVSAILVEHLQRDQHRIEGPARSAVNRLLQPAMLALADWLREILLPLVQAGAEAGHPIAASLQDSLHRELVPGRSGAELLHEVPELRNRSAHAGAPYDPAVARADLARPGHEALLYELLAALASLRGWGSLRAVGPLDDGQTRVVLRDAEGERTTELRSERSLAPGHYHLVDLRGPRDQLDAAQLIDLAPLVVFLPSPDRPEGAPEPYLFQRLELLGDEKHYVSHRGLRAQTTARFNQGFEALGTRWLGGLPAASPTSEDTVWARFRRLARQSTHRYLAAMTAGRVRSARVSDAQVGVGAKYDPDLYVPRRSQQAALAAFERTSERSGFVLLGGSGAGKTNLLCHEAQRLEDAGHLVLLVNASSFSSLTPTALIHETFESRTPIAELLSYLDELADRNERQVYLIFDAINECVRPGDSAGGGVGPAALIERLDQLILSHGMARVKLVMSCRSYTWEEAKRERNMGLDPGRYFTSRDIGGEDEHAHEHHLGGFTPQELADAYQRYQRAFELQTSWEELDSEEPPERLRLLSDPFRLNLLAHHYRGRALPERFDSLGLMRVVFEHLAPGGESERQGMMDMLVELVAELWRGRRDTLPERQLHGLTRPRDGRAAPLSYALWFDDQRHRSRFLRAALDANVLRIERGGYEPELRFTFDRLHEYLLAQHFLDRLRAAGGEREPAAFFHEHIEQLGDYAVGWGALRNAVLMQCARDSSDAPLASLAESPHYDCRSMAVEAVSTLTRERPEKGLQLLERLLEPGPALAQAADADFEAAESIRRSKGALERRRRLFIGLVRRLYRWKLSNARAQRDALRETLAPFVARKRVVLKVLYDLYRDPSFDVFRGHGSRSAASVMSGALADRDSAQRGATTLHLYYLWHERPERVLRTIEDHLDAYLQLGLFRRYRRSTIRTRVEPCARLSALALCDALLTGRGKEHLPAFKALWRRVIARLVGGQTIERIRPLIQLILTGAGRGLSEYVNNMTEYQHFWDEVPTFGPGWNRKRFVQLVDWLEPGRPGFEDQAQLIAQGAALGDAMSNYLIERVLIAQGVDHYPRVQGLIARIFEQKNKLPHYTQMSMLYVLFHMMDKSEAIDPDAFDDFERFMRGWTEATYGTFQGHYNRAANEGRPYKQYTLNWYGALHGKRWGDGARPLTLFHEYAERAFASGDTRLFLYVLDNIAMLAADFGYWKSAIGAFEHCLRLFREPRDLERFVREGCGQVVDIRAHLAGTLATIRGYYPAEVDHFVREELATTGFPGFERFRQDLLNVESGEKLGDLLTHKFGNLFVHGIVHSPDIRAQIQQVLRLAPTKASAATIPRVVASTVGGPLLGYDLRNPSYGVQPTWIPEGRADKALVWVLEIVYRLVWLPVRLSYSLFGWAKLDWVLLDLLSIPGALLRAGGSLFGERGRVWGVRANALEHSYLVCRFCPEERRALRDPTEAGTTCMWAARWARGEFEIEPHFGARNWMKQYVTDTDLTDYAHLAITDEE